MVTETVAEFLNETYESLRKTDATYSVRAFARSCGISSGRMSQILSGKAGISRTSAETVARNLKLADRRKNYFRVLAEYEAARSDRGRKLAMMKRLRYQKFFDSPQSDGYRLIADWYHIPICELTMLPGFKPSPAWIARQLGITEGEATTAIERLLKLRLLVRKNGTLVKTSSSIVVPDRPCSAELDRTDCQFIELAMRSLRSQPSKDRVFSTTVFRCRSEDLPVIRKKIREFRQALMVEAEAGTGHDTLYALGTQLFRLAPQAVEN